MVIMKKEKKLYTAPVATRVRLVVKNAVLGTCHASPVQTPRRALECKFETNCWTPPVGP